MILKYSKTLSGFTLLRNVSPPAWLRIDAQIISLLAFGALFPGWATPVTNSIAPAADCFLRSAVPAGNYGGGGALSVSGSAATNAAGVTNGEFGSLMRLSFTDWAADLNSAFGMGNWVVVNATLALTETASPDNAIFNIGIGSFEVRWLAANNWLEGTGKPKTPTADGVAWQDLPGLLDPASDQQLSVLTNTGTNVRLIFPLNLKPGFLSDIYSGAESTLYLSAVSPEIGFTFNSREFGNTNAIPILQLIAVANPRPLIDSLAISGTNVLVHFTAAPNWSYALQQQDLSLSAPWTEVATLPTPPTTNAVLIAPSRGDGGLYRLKATYAN